MVKKKAVEKNEDKFFKYFLLGFVIIVIVAAILLNNEEEKVVVINDGDVVMHYFYLDTCPHCKEQEEYHKVLLAKYPNLKILEYEMSKSSSREKFIELGNKVGLETEKIATPTTIVGNEYNVGFLNEAVTGLKLQSMIEAELNE